MPYVEIVEEEYMAPEVVEEEIERDVPTEVMEDGFVDVPEEIEVLREV